MTIKLIVMLASFASLPVFAQDTIRIDLLRTRQDSFEFLYRKYLYSKGDPEAKIIELKNQIPVDAERGDTKSALRKMQIALLLEKQVAPPTPAIFELNLSIGELIARINKVYALGFFEKATNIAKVTDGIHPSRTFHMYTNRAGVHQDLMEYDSARYYYYQAIHAGHLDNFVSAASTYNNLGYFYSDIKQLDSAFFYFHKALMLLGDKENHLSLYTAITDNIAQLDLENGDYRKAITTFQFNDSTYLALGYKNQYVINKVRLMKAADKINDPRVPDYIRQLQYFLDVSDINLDERALLDFYEFANDYYFRHQQRENQLHFRERMLQLQDRIEVKNSDELDQLAKVLLDVHESSLKSELNAFQLTADKHKIQLRATRVILIAATLALMLIILSLTLYIRKRRFEQQTAERIAHAELRAKEMEARLLQQDLELKKHDLTNIVLHNTQVYDANQKIIGKLEEIRKQKSNMDDHLRSLLIDLHQQSQIGERSIGLQSKIDAVNTEFYEKLKARYPALTKSEAELCGYIRIKLSTKDIAILKNVEATSVKMGKNRLRKKLGLSPEDDLYGFVSEI